MYAIGVTQDYNSCIKLCIITHWTFIVFVLNTNLFSDFVNSFWFHLIFILITVGQKGKGKTKFKTSRLVLDIKAFWSIFHNFWFTKHLQPQNWKQKERQVRARKKFIFKNEIVKLSERITTGITYSSKIIGRRM